MLHSDGFSYPFPATKLEKKAPVAAGVG